MIDIINEDLITTDAIPYLSCNGAQVFVLRLDKIHDTISGNKWYKLKFYIDDARQQGKSIVTFGGAFSNHIAATAAACRIYNIKCTGIIRGERPAQLSHTLQKAVANGMQLIFLSREDYKQKLIPGIISTHENIIIPEGGYGVKGALGAASINYNKNKFDIICCATGTGTMMAGLINGKHATAKVAGISVLKNNYEIENAVQALLINKNDEINIVQGFHFGGYAKYTPQLISFMNELYAESRIPTDFVYTGKLFYAVQFLVKQNKFTDKKVLVIHSGGLQGNQSLRKGTLIF